MPASEAEIARKIRLAGELGRWIGEYRELHGNISLYFWDRDLEVWLIDQADLLRDDWQNIWRPESPGAGDGR